MYNKENNKYSLPIRLWKYQNERSPLAILIPISALIVGLVYNFSEEPFSGYLVSVAIVALYMIQVRASDEKKDFEFDNKHYKNRPVQRGLIDLKELSLVNHFVIVGQLVLFALFMDLHIFLVGLLLQGYAFLTRKEFYIKGWLRTHFFLYNSLHYVQVIIIYYAISSILNPVNISQIQLLIYFLLNMTILEVIRKISPRDEDSVGDTYSANIGYGWVSFILFGMSASTIMLSYVITAGNLVVVSGFIIVLGILTTFAFKYWRNPTKTNTKYIKISSFSMVVASVFGIIFGA